MKVILLDEIKGKGGEGDVVEVAQGYAENFLFPKKLAVAATKGNLKQLDERRNNIAKREETRLADAEAMRAKLDGATVKVLANVGEEGQLFGSVTSSIVADAIKENLGVEVDLQAVFFRELLDLFARFLALDEAELRRLRAEDDVVEHGEHVDELEVLVHHADAERGGIIGVVDLDGLAVFASGWYRPKSTLMSVDLPAPFSPSRAWISPFLSCRVMSSLALIPGNSLVM